jgi:putative DNA primase/helicase
MTKRNRSRPEAALQLDRATVVALRPEEGAGQRSEGRTLPLTDLGNAERFVALHGNDLRYARAIGGWVHWDERRWQPDTNGEADRRMKATIRSIAREASRPGLDLDEVRAILQWAIYSESAARIAAALKLGQTEKQVVVDPAQFDADPWLLNVPNGTLDLRTGTLRDHRREDLITKIAGAAFVRDARHAGWDRFVRETTGGDPEYARYLQKAFGQSLIGRQNEEKVFVPYGPGATGKSTMLEAVGTSLGGYARTAEFTSFTKKSSESSIRNDLAALAGARFVKAVEVGKDSRFNEAVLKSLTGGDTISARFLFREYFDFTPVFTLFLATNHLPQVSATDDAIWRRLLLLPFMHQVPERERDSNLKLTLTTDPDALAAVLAWLVEGCLDYQAEGLQEPDLVRQHTTSYRVANDQIGDWISDCAEADSTAFTLSRDLRESYERWCKANSIDPLTQNAFAAELRDRGLETGRSGHGGARGWNGIRLVTR